MNNFKKKIFSLLLILVSFNAIAQPVAKNYKAIDVYVQKLGSLDTLNMGTITAIITKPFTDKKDKARAIFDWIAYNISFDVKAGRTANTQKNSPTEVLLYRKAVGIGYASLFQDMCSSANIRCLTADGFIKTNAEQIEDTKTDINHSWAVVQLGLSPEEWFYVDPAMGSGYTDADFKIFTKSYNDAYFFADKTIFNLQHYPDNEVWKLGPAPKNKKDFYALPLIRSAAYKFKLTGLYPNNGRINVKAMKLQQLGFKLDSAEVISKVTLLVEEHKKRKQQDVIYSVDKGLLNITCKFDESGSYPVTVVVNGKELATYLVEVE